LISGVAAENGPIDITGSFRSPHPVVRWLRDGYTEHHRREALSVHFQIDDKNLSMQHIGSLAANRTFTSVSGDVPERDMSG
jgi:hypothetical protein